MKFHKLYTLHIYIRSINQYKLSIASQSHNTHHTAHTSSLCIAFVHKYTRIRNIIRNVRCDIICSLFALSLCGTVENWLNLWVLSAFLKCIFHIVGKPYTFWTSNRWVSKTLNNPYIFGLSISTKALWSPPLSKLTKFFAVIVALWSYVCGAYNSVQWVH